MVENWEKCLLLRDKVGRATHTQSSKEKLCNGTLNNYHSFTRSYTPLFQSTFKHLVYISGTTQLIINTVLSLLLYKDLGLRFRVVTLPQVLMLSLPLAESNSLLELLVWANCSLPLTYNLVGNYGLCLPSNP